MVKSKLIRFNFLRPTLVEHDKDDKAYNLSELFDKIIEEYREGNNKYRNALKERKDITEEDKEELQRYMYTDTYLSDTVKLSHISQDPQTTYYHIIFERLDYLLPEISKEFGESRQIDAEENEFIGHKISCLYDPSLHCLIIQRNIASLGTKAIQQFINELLFRIIGTDEFVRLDVITEDEMTKKALRQSSYRSVALKVNRKKAQDIIRNTFQKDLSGAYSIEIKIVAENKKNAELDNEDVKNLINEFAKDLNDEESKEYIDKLIIRAREEEEDSIQDLDLIKQKIQAVINIDIAEERTLSHIKIFERMVDFYRNQERPFNRLV